MSTHVLILGGTTEARALAAALADRPACRVTTSLAGRVTSPARIDGELRTGGFGGAEGLAAWLREERVDALIDATHPFAAVISAHAAEAAGHCAVPVLALRRPGWSAGRGDVWHDVRSLPEAAELLPELGRRVFLTTGRQGLAAFAGLAGHFLVRSVEPPDPPMPAHTEVLLARGPFTVADELELLRTHRIDVLVPKGGGGAATAARLVAARELSAPVVVVRRPPVPAGVPSAPDVAGVLAWLDGRADHGR
ncbi:cobalt-precorrin-6A reductase [Streptomyces sp. N35]|uniref:cobalt-precorrin-6A reductase n=1 Tax=Streptomyces sp. N35 TaxID=2795730 RepID=UPI0018F76960|nr:cobalt-precorrin-6A reductase [Streptomyces sp. N35]